MKKYRSIVSLLFILISHLTFGQDYPVQVTTVLTPPYSLYLADYTSPESNNLQVIIHLRELDRPEYRVKLRITIEGQGITIRTRPGYMPAPLILQGGVPEMLSGADLSRYLNPDNLDFSGISRQEFMKKGAFPEGFYTFRIEVLDYVRNVVVSNPGLANAWMILNDPPLINFPSNHEKVIASDPQNVMFNWTPLHTGSPNAAFSTEYEFTLVELYPEGRNPNDALRVTNPIFVTTTPSTSLNYGVMEPMLIPGRKYAFRIKAFDTSKRDLFKNNGYSEVFVFQFGDACIPPLNIKSESLDPNRIKITWEPADIHTAFTIQYKKKGSSTWLEEKSYTNSIILPGLQGNTAYQYQVSGVCGTISGVLSEIASITTLEKKEDEFSCGAPAPTIEIKTTPLLEDLRVDDLIKTADFEVSLTTVEKNSDGSYKGTGRAFLPWLNFATVRVKFSSIRVNEEYRVYDGIVITVYSPNSRFVANLDLADELDNNKDAEDQKNNASDEDKFEGIEIPYEGDIKDITFNPATGEVTVTNEDGTTTVLPLEKNEETDKYEDTRITDSNGDKWVIGSDGKVTQEPSTTAPNAITSADTIDFTVQFAANADQNYGFDKKTDDKLGTYDVIKVQEQDYTVFWKSVETGHQDFINALTAGKEEFPSMVGFKTSTGPAASMPGVSKDQKQIIIIGQGNKRTWYEFTEDQLTAYVKVKEEGKEETEVEVGRINVATYDKVKKRLIIVPVNNADAEDGNSLTAAINSIYQQAVAEWEITVEEKFTIDPEKLTGLDAGKSGMLGSFPDKCRNFNREFKDARSIDKDAYYLFLIEGSGSSRSGFMPFKRKFGYIFTDNLGSLSLATTIAHELGHGAFRLRHTFSSEAFMAAERSTNNLMDYKGGTELKKYQWDHVHDPESMNGWLQEDDDAAMSSTMSLVKIPVTILPDAVAVNGKPCSPQFLLPANVVAEMAPEKLNAIKNLVIKDNRLESFDFEGRTYTPAFTADINDQGVFQGTSPTYYYVDLSGVEKAPEEDPESGITEAQVVDDAKVSHTVFYGVFKTKYAIALTAAAKCEGEVVTGNGLNCYTVQKVDCSHGAGTGSANGIVVNLTTQAFDNEDIRKLLSGQSKINDSKAGESHNTVVKVFLTDSQDDFSIVENYKPENENEIVLWLHFQDGHWTIKSGLPGSIKEISDIYARRFKAIDVNEMLSALESIYKLNPLDGIMVGMYEFFDRVGKFVRKPQIPEYVWNCDSQDKANPYQPAYAVVYGYLVSPLSSLLSQQVLPAVSGLRGMDPKFQQGLNEVGSAIDKANQIQFALVIGVWDAIWEIPGGLADILEAIYMLQSSKGINDFQKIYNQMSGYTREDPEGTVVSSGIWGCVSDGFVDAFDPTQPCKFSHNIAPVVLAVVITVVTEGAGAETFASTGVGKFVMQILKVLSKIDAVTDRLSVGSYVGKFVGKVGSAGFKQIIKASGKVLYKIENGFFIAKLYTKDLLGMEDVRIPVESFSGITEDGGTYILKSSGSYNDRQLVPDINDVFESTLKISKSQADELVAKGISYSKLQSLLNKVADSEKATFANMLNKLELGDDLGKVAQDLIDNQKLFDYFQAKGVFGAKQVGDIWKGLKDRPDWVRTNTDLLERVSNNPQLASKVNDYYRNAIPSNTPSGFNGEGMYSGVYFNKYGHPELKPHVSSPDHIVKIQVKGNYTSDFTDAKNKLIQQAFGGDATRVRKAINPNTGTPASGWSPFEIKNANGEWDGPYTWHHHQDGTSMYPVKKTVHDAIIGKHTGGREIVTQYPDLIDFFIDP